MSELILRNVTIGTRSTLCTDTRSVKYVYENHRNCTAQHREHRTSTTWCVFPTSLLTASIVAVILQVTGQKEKNRSSQTEDRQQDCASSGQADQGPCLRWTTARLFTIIKKNLKPNSEPILYTRANSEPHRHRTLDPPIVGSAPQSCD